MKNLLLPYSQYLIALLIVTAIFATAAAQTYLINPRVVVKPEEHFFQDNIEVNLDILGARPKAEIRYTLDGSDPSSQSYLYTQPLTINETTVLKAAVFIQGQRRGEILVHDFFIQAKHELPVVSIVTDPKNLWDPVIGIYTIGLDPEDPNYMQRGKEWERPAQFHFYESNQQLVVDQKIGLRIHGGGSRELPQKTLRLYADPDETQATFNYQFFPNSNIDRFETLLLRNAGGDWEKSFMRDVIVNRIAGKYSNLDYMIDRPVVVYLNGQYWGIHYLRDRFDKEYFSQKYGLDRSRISLLEVPHEVGEKRGQVEAEEKRYKDDAKLYTQLLEEAMRCDECASYHYFKQYLDMESLIDYFIFQIHFANYDWPFGNTKVWRYHNTLVEREPKLSQYFPSGLDGRFRWYLYDMDVAFAFNKAQNNDISQDDVIDSALRVGYERLIDNRFPFRNLFNDAAFQEHYFNRYANFLNTAFSPKQVNAEIDQLLAEIGSEMPHHLERWKKEKSLLGITCPQSYEEWMHQVNLLRVYSQYRVDGIRQNSLEKFAEVFKNYKMVKLTLSSNNIQAGGIKVHQTLFSENDLPFSGLYFPNLFLNLEAVPASGYRFVRWEGDVPDHKKTNDQLRLKLNQDYQLKAIFEKKSLF